MAEGEGFEPPDAFTPAVFKTAAISRSAIPPQTNFVASRKWWSQWDSNPRCRRAKAVFSR